MGKARVTDNLGEGQYDFELIYSDERAQARIDFLNEIIGLNEDLQLVKLQADLAVAQAEVNVQADKVDAAIADWVDAGTWTADTDYSIGDRVRINGLATMLCEQSGRSGSIIPAWPEKHGDTIRENHVNWNMSVEDQLGGSFWSTSTNYVINDKVIAVPNIIVEGEPKNIYATATLNGRSGFFEPSWTQSGTITEGGVIWRREDRLHAIVEANKELLERRVKRDKAAADVQVLKTYILSWKREKAFIERHLPAQVLKVAGWCADYSPDIPIDTEVETAEVTGFHHGGLTSAGKAADRTVLIRPQEPPADYPPSILTPAGDVVQLSEVPAGKLRHAVACTPSECLYALMIEPGAEKWRPTWRVGVIDSIDRDADTCSVTLLFADAPRYSDLPVQHNINETVVLTDVPIRYMTCNSAAFEVGDRVLIEYPNQDRAFPTVRGFESNPRVCPGGFLCLPTSDSESLNKHILRFGGAGWTAKESALNAGNVSWYGTHYAAVSWTGSPARNIAPDPQKIGGDASDKFPFTAVRDPEGDEGASLRYVFQNFGNNLWVSGVLQSGPGGTVVGAGIRIISNIPWLYCITTNNGTRVDTFWRRLLSGSAWESIASWAHPSGIGLHMAGWFFNTSGTEASCILPEYYDDGGGTIVYRPTLWSVTPGSAPVKASTGPNLELTTDVTASNSCSESESDASTSSTTFSGAGNQAIAVDYQGDVRVTADYIYDFSGSASTSYSGFSTFTYSASVNGSGGTKIKIGLKEVSMGAVVATSVTTSLTNSSGVVVGSIVSEFDNIDSLFLYLDLRHDEAIIYEERTDSSETWTAAGPPADKFDYSLDQTIDRRVYILSSGQNLITHQEIISDTDTLFRPDLLPSCGEDTTGITVSLVSTVVEPGGVGYDESTADEYAQIDRGGRLFVSVTGQAIDVNLTGYGVHLDSGDPAALTGLAGANPRFYPILLA